MGRELIYLSLLLLLGAVKYSVIFGALAILAMLKFARDSVPILQLAYILLIRVLLLYCRLSG